jgi:hypothetical protein
MVVTIVLNTYSNTELGSLALNPPPPVLGPPDEKVKVVPPGNLIYVLVYAGGVI